MIVRTASIFMLLFVSAFLTAAPTAVAQVFQIDIDSTTGGPIDTAPGWISLDASEPSNDNSVTVNGVTFTVFSADGSRVRGGPNPLTRDFIFDDGENAAVGLRVFDLPDGVWDAQVWSWDNDFDAGTQIVGIANFPGPRIFTESFTPSPTDPFNFRFNSPDYVEGFGIFTRENNEPSDRARFNALRLTRVPALAHFDFEDQPVDMNNTLPTADVIGLSSDLDQVGISHGARSQTSDANAFDLRTTALLLSPSSIGAEPPTSDDDYLTFSYTNTGSREVSLADLSFEWTLSADTDLSGGLTAAAQLFASINGAAFAAVGDQIDHSTGNGEVSSLFPQVDLGSLPSLQSGDSIEFRLAFADNSGAFSANKGHYIDNIVLSRVIPEPTTLVLVGLGMGGLCIRRRTRVG